MNPFIRIQNISKSFGATRVLDDISFHVNENEFVVIIGPSGCGKSTLLKIIGGVLTQSSGSVSIQEKVTNPDTIKGKIGFIFQKPVLLPWRTIYENIRLPFEILDMECHEQKIEEYLDMVKLTDFKNDLPYHLSGGEEQRIALVRALAFNPLVLLMDEPFGALDAILRKTMNFDLLKIWHEQRKTVLFVTHDIDEAVFIADKVIILSPKPSNIKEIISIDLPRPRKWAMRHLPQYQEIVRSAEAVLQ